MMVTKEKLQKEVLEHYISHIRAMFIADSNQIPTGNIFLKDGYILLAGILRNVANQLDNQTKTIEESEVNNAE